MTFKAAAYPIAIVAAVSLLNFGQVAWADPSSSPECSGIGLDCAGKAAESLPKEGNATKIIGDIILWLTSLVVVLALAAIVYGGLKYILSLGDPKKTEDAKKVIIYAVVGLIVAGAADVVILLVKKLFFP